MFTNAEGEKENGIAEVGWKHEHVIDWMIANPAAKQAELAREFKLSETWVSLMINSDAFQAAYDARRKEIIDPVLMATVETRLRGVAKASLDRMMEKLTHILPPSDEFILKSVELSTKALGYGARNPSTPGQVNVGVQVVLPAKATESEWKARYSPTGGAPPGTITDAGPEER